MKAGYIESQLDSESPDVSRKPDRSKGAEPLREVAGGAAPQTQSNSRISKVLFRAQAESQSCWRKTISHTWSSLRCKVSLRG